jgi:hypothetical protein
MNLSDLFALPSADDGGLAQLLMLAAQRGNHPMGGPKQYTNDYFFGQPRQQPRGYLPDAWAPPGQNMLGAPPFDPNAPRGPQFKWAPTHRLPAKRPGVIPEAMT